MVLHSCIGDQELSVCFGAVTKLSVEKRFKISFQNFYMQRIFPSSRLNQALDFKTCLYQRKRMQDRKMNDLSRRELHIYCDEMTKPGRDTRGRTVIPPRSELSMLVVSTAAGLRLMESKVVAMCEEQFSDARGVANIFHYYSFTTYF